MILYPSTKRQITPRKRFEGVKPRTFNYYCTSLSSSAIHTTQRYSVDWLPSHLLIIHILLLFAVLNPLVIPFGLLYFCVETGTSSLHLVWSDTYALLVSCDKEPGTIVGAQVSCEICSTDSV